ASGLVQIQPNSGRLGMNPKDIEHLGLNETSHVTVSSAIRSVRLRIKPDHNVMPGTCFYPEHFIDPPVKDLMTVEADPITGVPYFQSTRVSIEKVGS
ncbi:MAG: molybdopterin dinucleotide binding domain-containing protein, partial [Nitrospiraceae bacterium]